MKPTKNTIFCYGCQRTKMLFETKAKADNFIRYNSEGIQEENGKAPVRSYYCGICGGYHVTSNPSATEGEKMDSRDRQRVENFTRQKREKEEARALAQTVSNRVVRIKHLLKYGELTDAEALLDVCYLDLEEIHKYPLTAYSKQSSLREKVERAKELFLQVKEVLGLPEQEQQAFISQLSPDSKQYSLVNVLSHAFKIRRIEHLLLQTETLLDEGETNGVAQAISECKHLVGEIAALEKNKSENLQEAEARLHEVERRLHRLKDKKKTEGSQSKDSAEKAGDEYSEDGSSAPEDAEDSPRVKPQSKEYVSTILQLIKKLEQIQKAYEEEDYDNCESLVEIVSFILDDLDARDENVKTIADQLDNWKQRLGMS